MRGVPLKVIQELLGHASIVTTMRYAHLAPHVARDAVRVLDRVRPPAAAPNSAPKSSPPAADPVAVAKDWRKPPRSPVTN
jgi:Phage integrase family